MSRLREFAVFVLFLGALFAIVAHCAGCRSVEQASAAKLFDEDLRDCRKKPTFEEKDSCTDDVLRKWHLASGIRDAGSDR